MDTQALGVKLRERYEGPSWAVVFDVANATGTACSRRCDAMAMGLWPSKGLYLHGHEMKVSRSDWLKELDDPSKSDAFARHCHYWWIVAPKGIVKIAELPSSWGLLHCTESSCLRVASMADQRIPVNVSFEFLAALLRAATQQTGVEATISKARHAAYQKGRDDGRKAGVRHAEVDLERARAHAAHLEGRIEEFEAASGIEIGRWGAGRIGDAVKMLIGSDHKGLARDAERLLEHAKSVVAECEGLKSAAAELAKLRE